jgi:hypothetical protein
MTTQMPYAIDDAVLARISEVDTNVLKSTNLTNTNLSHGFCDTNGKIQSAETDIRREIASGLCDTNSKIASTECGLDRDIYQNAQKTIDTLGSSMERKAIANDLNASNHTNNILSSVTQNGQRGIDATERNGAGNVISTMTASAQNLAAIERANSANVVATDRNGAAIMLSNERIILENHRLGSDMTNQHNLHNIDALKGMFEINANIASRYSKNEERQNDRHQRLELELARHNAASQLQGSENYSRLQLELCKMDNNLGKDILKTSADAKYQSIDNLRQTQLDSIKLECTVSKQHEQVLNNICRMESKLELQAEKNTASIQLEALRNRSDILCKIDTCCCELKSELKNSDCDRLRDRNLILEFERRNSNGGHH